jgi:hypothetical protein
MEGQEKPHLCPMGTLTLVFQGPVHRTGKRLRTRWTISHSYKLVEPVLCPSYIYHKIYM